MYCYSGNCVLAKCGIEVSFKDIDGKDLHTGDIVVLWYRNNEDEDWHSCYGLTAVVEDKYTSYSDGTIKIEKDGKPFVMGIRTIDLLEDKQWGAELVKKYSDVVDGERWPSYGFKYSSKEIQIQDKPE